MAYLSQIFFDKFGENEEYFKNAPSDQPCRPDGSSQDSFVGSFLYTTSSIPH